MNHTCRPPAAVLREHMALAGLNQSQLAQVLRRSPGGLSRVLSGRNRISPALDAALSQVLATEPGYWRRLEQQWQQLLRAQRPMEHQP